MKTGKLFLVVGPSGVGKGTLVDQLRQRHPEFFFPPSATTRLPRAGECDGGQYIFLSPAEFTKLEHEGGFLETAVVHSTERYGTLKNQILEAIESGKVVIREVDIQGLKTIQRNLPREMFAAIFLTPPDLATLEKRISHRQPKITTPELARRLASAQKELAQKDCADFMVVSGEGEIEKMVAEVEKIIVAEVAAN